MDAVDTICVISSPPGEGGIGIIRLSGPDAHRVLKAIFKPRLSVGTYDPRRLYLGYIVNPQSDQEIDEVFAVFMNPPHTYTREEMAEVYSHGGLAPQRRILSLMVSEGARIAEPGEFTKRAFLNGRIDLVQAEAVLDIIQSESDEELRLALGQLKGGLSVRLAAIREGLVRALAEIEAQIDFPEEDLDLSGSGVLSELEKAGRDLSALIASYAEGKAVRYGVEVLIVGRTNVGKSSILNRLLMEERAIVTPLPGTTRDMVEDTIHIKGLKMKIVDTAGMRRPRGVIEEKGIEKVRERIPGADVILWVIDGSRRYSADDEETRLSILGKEAIAVVNKIDLPRRLSHDLLSASGLPLVEVSALTGEGLDGLKATLYDRFMARGHGQGSLLVTNVRHRDALDRTRLAIEGALTSALEGRPLEFTAFDTREALTRLGQLTGEACADEILDEIFSRFCIGK